MTGVQTHPRGRRVSPTFAVLLVLATTACGSRRIEAVGWGNESDASPAVKPVPDPKPPSLGTDPTDLDAGPSTEFFVMVTQTPMGADPTGATWGGILRYDIASNTAQAIPGQGIDKSAVRDPLGLAFRKKSAEMFVGNRNGNASSTITRFFYDADSKSFTPTGAPITAPGLDGVMQIAFNLNEDELFAGTNNHGLYRFKLDSAGNWQPNGTLANGAWIRGLAVSPDGKRLYASSAFNVIQQFDLSTSGTPELAQVTVPASTSSGTTHLHYMWRAENELYVGTFDASVIAHFTIGPNDDLTLTEMIPATNSPSGVALSPDGQEMFSLGTVNSQIIQRMTFGNGSWAPTTTIQASSTLGCALVFLASSRPEPK